MDTSERTVRWSDRHALALDVAGTVLLALVVVPLSTSVRSLTDLSGARNLVDALCALGIVAPLAWRRIAPAAAAAVSYSVALLHLVPLGIPLLLPADLVLLLVLYSVTTHGPRWAHRVALGGAMVGSLLMGAMMTQGSPVGSAEAVGLIMIAATMFLAAWALGLVRRSGREHLEALVERARRLEVERDQQAQLGAAGERARIAREMHDIVAHSLTVMIAQADGGRYAASSEPAAATRALETIAGTGRAALTDMRRLLGVLRADATDEPGPTVVGTGPGATAPQPAEGDLAALVEQVRAAGLRVSMVRVGTPRTLPPGTGLTVYRIAQESLTNVLKHAGPDPAVTVALTWQSAAVVLEVSDDGRGAAAGSDGRGRGLRGMSDRAEMFGGTVTAGPRPGGGYRVRAQLPTPTRGPER